MKKLSNCNLKKINGGSNQKFWENTGKVAGAATYCTVKLGWINLVPGATALCTAARA